MEDRNIQKIDYNICFEKIYSIRNPEKYIPFYKIDNIEKIQNQEDYLKPSENNLLKINEDLLIIPGNNISYNNIDIIEYIKDDLNIQQLNELGHILKAASFNKFYTLTELIRIGYDIKITNDCFYHLINNGKLLYMKPLPIWMSDGIFIEKLLKLIYKYDDKLFIITNINGFLTSYRKLIKTKLDYEYAIELKMIDKDIMTWYKWQRFHNNMETNNIFFIKSKRYSYQVLNMTNINIVFFIFNFKLLYPQIKISISDFIMKYYIIGLYFFAFSSVFLSVAQVIITLPISNDNLNNWSKIFYPFSIIVLIIIFILLLIILLTFIFVFVTKILRYLKDEWVPE